MCKLRKTNFKTYALCFSECVKIAGKELKRMNTLTMARRKKEVTPNRQLAQAILDQYQPKSVEDMQDALKDIFGPMFEAMLQGEMNSHLGYSSNERGDKEMAIRKRL